MNISRKALERIRRLKRRQRLPRQTGLRLGLENGGVILKWAGHGPKLEDLVVMQRELPVFIDAQTYLHLADYELDFERGRLGERFLLRRRMTE